MYLSGCNLLASMASHESTAYVSLSRSLTFISGDETVYAYYARPEGDGPFPGVVVLHEVFGLTETIKNIAQRFADAGYAALAVDLFRGTHLRSHFGAA